MNSRATEDALRRKGTSLLRDWATCPECGERGTLQVSIPASAERLALAITCGRNRCNLKTYFPSSFIHRLGSVADSVRRTLELEEKRKTASAFSRAAGDIFRDNAGAGFYDTSFRDVVDNDERNQAARFREFVEKFGEGFTWEDLMGKLGRRG